jgi:hypothetical protein
VKNEIMDWIYEKDYKFTTKVQRVAIKVYLLTRLGPSTQYLILNLTSLFTSIALGTLTPSTPMHTWIIFFILYLGVFEFLIPPLVGRIHLLLDKNVNPIIEMYSSGYRAWTRLLIGLTSIICGFIFYGEITHGMVNFGLLYLASSYFAFVLRFLFPPRKRSKKLQTSSALEKLLERCKEWLGQRQPLPTN